MYLDLLILDIIYFYENLPLNGAVAEKRAHRDSTTNSCLLKKGKIFLVKLRSILTYLYPITSYHWNNLLHQILLYLIIPIPEPVFMWVIV